MAEATPNSQKYFIGLLYTVLGAAGFSLKAIFAKLCYQDGISGFATLTLRMLFSLPFYLAVFCWYYAKEPPPLQQNFRRQILPVSATGLLGYYFASWFDFVGLEYVSASFERLLLFIYPTLVFIISFVWLKVRAGRRELAALAITYAGIGLSYYEERNFAGNAANIGAVYILLAAVTYAIYLVATERLAHRYSPLLFTSFAILVSSLAIIAHGVLAGEKLLGHPPRVYWLILAMAIFSTVLPSLFVALGIALIGSNRAAVIGTLGPALTIWLAHRILGDAITPAQLAGTACVLLGVTLLAIQHRRKTAHG
ncbi:MAG: DMT family transporter [Turneriella sp.]|nr:DMT family transporter [Turneriella sp.]